MTEAEHIIFRLANYEAPYKKGLRSSFVTAPMEDKKNPLIITAPRIILTESNKLNGIDYVDYLITQMVIPDLLRMKHETPDFENYNPKNYYLIPNLNNYNQLHDLNFFYEELMDQNNNVKSKNFRHILW